MGERSIGVLVALGGAPFEAAVLASLAGDRTHVVRRCVDLADLLATAASGQADVALIAADLDGLDRNAVEAVEQAEVSVVGVVDGAGSGADALRRMGAERIAVVGGLLDGVQPTVLAAAAGRATAGVATPSAGHPAAQSRRDDEPGRRGRVIAVWGPTGAPGRSVVALGLGAVVAEAGAEALVIDADVYGGSIAQLAGVLDETSGLLAAARAANTGSLDPAGLTRRCLQVAPSLRVLTGLPRADRWVEARAGLVRTVLDNARRIAEVAIVDCGFSVEVDEEVMYDTQAPRRNGATLAVLEQADTVLAVGAADPVGLSRLVRAIGDLRDAVPASDPVVVVNRLRESMGWTSDDVAATVRRTTDVADVVCLPNDPRSCDRALLAGETLVEAAPEGRLTRSLRELSARLTGLPAASSARSSWNRRPRRQGRKSSHRPVSV